MSQRSFQDIFSDNNNIKIITSSNSSIDIKLRPKDLIHRLAIITVFRDSNNLFKLNGKSESSEFIVPPSYGGIYRAAKDGVCVTCRSLVETMFKFTINTTNMSSHLQEKDILHLLFNIKQSIDKHDCDSDIKKCCKNKNYSTTYEIKSPIINCLRYINFSNYTNDRRMISLIRILNMANKCVAHSDKDDLDHKINNGFDLIWGPDILAELIAKSIEKNISLDIFDHEHPSFPKIPLWGNGAEENRKFRVNWIEPTPIS